MNEISLQLFEKLKLNLTKTAGIPNILPSDCKALSDSIIKKTNKRISETTLKRVFGFAQSKFKPSLFTVDAMAQYCGYGSWIDYCQKQNEYSSINSPVKAKWDAFNESARKITNYTLQALKNRSGIPYKYAIKRDFFEVQIAAFLKSGLTATVFAAPAGYGKTVALCQWVDGKMVEFEQTDNDILLFFSSNALLNTNEGPSLNEWFLSLLGYEDGGNLASLFNEHQSIAGNFYLIVDGFDEQLFKIEQFQLLFNQLLDIISIYKDCPWFKVILTMRSSTWINNKYSLSHLKDHWFTNFYDGDDLATNVPPFSAEEIVRLSVKINPHTDYIVNSEVVKSLNNPLYFQFYYQNNADNFSLDQIDDLNMHELVASYVLNKIYLGPKSSEKLLLINGLVDVIDFRDKVYTINKLKVYSLVKQYNYAYNDLLSLGYLRELNTSNGLSFGNYIEFSTSHFLEHAVAQILLFNNNYLFNGKIISAINEYFANNFQKLAILKWCIMYAIKNGQSDNLRFIGEVRLPVAEKADLILFIRELFEKEFSFESAAIEKQFYQENHSELFDYFFGIEFINTHYEKSLHTLLKFKLTNNRKISIYTSLAITAIIQMDMTKLEDYLGKLKSFSPDDFKPFAVNPFDCLDTIYSYLRFGIIKTTALRDLTKFYFNPPVNGPGVINNSTNDVIYFLAIYTLSINLNHHKTLRFINALNKTYKKPTDDKTGFNFLLKLITAETNFSLNRFEEGLKIFKEVTAIFEREKDGYTTFMKTTFHLLKVKIELVTGKDPDVLEIIKPLFYLADEAGYKLLKVHCLVLLLASQKKMKDKNYYKKVYFDFIRIVKETGFRRESFIREHDMML